MRLGPHRRNLVVWSQAAGPAGRCRAPRITRRPRTRGRIRRWIRTSVLLTVIGLMRLARAVRDRWRPVLAGTVLTVAGFVLRGGPASVILVPGLLLLLSAPLVEASPKADRARRSALERELAGCSSPAQRRDLEAILDRYPDDVTRELRDILTRQTMAGRPTGIPGALRGGS
jgi:hypothetical protein